jgi:hypothetical protein
MEPMQALLRVQSKNETYNQQHNIMRYRITLTDAQEDSVHSSRECRLAACPTVRRESKPAAMTFSPLVLWGMNDRFEGERNRAINKRVTC